MAHRTDCSIYKDQVSKESAVEACPSVKSQRVFPAGFRPGTLYSTCRKRAVCQMPPIVLTVLKIVITVFIQFNHEAQLISSLYQIVWVIIYVAFGQVR